MLGSLKWDDYDPMVFERDDLKHIFADVTQARAAEIETFLDAADIYEKNAGRAGLTPERRQSLRESCASDMGSNVAMSISMTILNRAGKNPSLEEVKNAYDDAAIYHKGHYDGLKKSAVYVSDDFYRAQVDIMEVLSLALIERMKRYVLEHNDGNLPTPTRFPI